MAMIENATEEESQQTIEEIQAMKRFDHYLESGEACVIRNPWSPFSFSFFQITLIARYCRDGHEYSVKG